MNEARREDPGLLLDDRSALRNRSRTAVFLCYHSITDNGPPYLSMTPATFERQLDLLVARGVRSGNLETLRRVASGQRLDGRHAFLTFDDGFRDTVTTALPRMAERGFTGIVFVLPGHLDSGRPLIWPEVAGEVQRRPELMRSIDWKLAERLTEAGWEIGSHGMSHSRLTELPDDALAEELGESRRLIVERFGHCDLFAYPFGEWDERVAAAVMAAGYEFAFALPFEHQLHATRMSIPRVMLDDRDAPWRFRAKLSGVGRTALFSPLRPMIRRAIGRHPHSHAQ